MPRVHGFSWLNSRYNRTRANKSEHSGNSSVTVRCEKRDDETVGLFEFQFAFNNCIRLIFIGMQSGLVEPGEQVARCGAKGNGGLGELANERASVFSELSVLSRHCRGSAGGIVDEDNKSKALAGFVFFSRALRGRK